MVAPIKNPQTLLAAIRHFDTDTACRYVESIKWPDGPCCPKCGSINVGKIASRARLQCREKGCRKQFSLTTGTIFEATHLKLDQWIMGVWMIVNCRNGVSSCEIARDIGCKQQSAWHLLHRVRHLLQQDVPAFGADGSAVECDSTFVGGIMKNMSYERQQRARKAGKWGKTEVHAMKDRATGQVRARILDDEFPNPTVYFIADNVHKGAMVYTDKGMEYRWLKSWGYGHDSVNHTALEYVRGETHVNGMENYFNCLRRGLKGTYIAATPGHLAAYVDEQTWRFNHRELTDWERFDRAMRLVVGKRLTYADLTDGATR